MLNMQLLTIFGRASMTKIDEHLKKQKATRTIKLQVGSFDFLPPMMKKNTNLITTLPSQFGNTLMQSFASIDCPLRN